MANFPQGTGPGAFIPTTDIFDTQRIYQLDINSDEFKEFLVRLRQSVNDIALLLNLKDTGYYVLEEFINSKVWFPDPALTSTTPQAPVFRQEFRTCVNFGSLPNAGTKSVAHNIANIGAFTPSTYTVTRIDAGATDPTTPEWIPIPFSSPVLNENIKITVDATNVNITTAIDYTAFTRCLVVIEYIKQ